MRMFIYMKPPFPPGLDITWGPPDYAKFGWGAWRYNTPGAPLDAHGPIEWINTTEFCTEPKYDNPVSFDFFLKDGVIFEVYYSNVVRPNTTGLKLNGITINPATGEGFPWAVAPP